MELLLTIIQNNSGVAVKNEKTDEGIKQVKEKICRIAARSSDNAAVIQFTTDYETGKRYELDKQIKVTIE